MSIFLKDCPECAAKNPTGAVRCECGYSFERGKTGTSLHALELAMQEEQLYLDYLTARVHQARDALEIATATLAADPENKVKAANVLLAEQALNAARAELAVQHSKVRAAESRITAATARGVRAERRVTSASLATPPVPKAAPVSGPAAPRGGPKKPTVKARMTAPVTPAPAAARQKSAVRSATPAPVAPPARTVAGTRTASGKPVAKPAPAPPTAARRPTPTPSANRRTDHGSRPNPAFRAAQAAKAAKVVKILRTQDKVAGPTHAPVATPERPAAPTIAAPAAIPPAQMKDCPSCTATLPLNEAQCRCGYAFSDGADMPGIGLSPSDFALFSESLDIGKR